MYLFLNRISKTYTIKSHKMKKIITISFLFITTNTYSQVNTNINISNERQAVMQPESSIINIPLQCDLSKYKKIVLSVQGWAASLNEKDIRNALKQSIFIVDKKRFNKDKTEMEEDTIYFFWNRSEDGDDRTTTIIIRDYNMKVLYSATHTNVGRAKMLDFILSL